MVTKPGLTGMSQINCSSAYIKLELRLASNEVTNEAFSVQMGNGGVIRKKLR